MTKKHTIIVNFELKIAILGTAANVNVFSIDVFLTSHVSGGWDI